MTPEQMDIRSLPEARLGKAAMSEVFGGPGESLVVMNPRIRLEGRVRCKDAKGVDRRIIIGRPEDPKETKVLVTLDS